MAYLRLAKSEIGSVGLGVAGKPIQTHFTHPPLRQSLSHSRVNSFHHPDFVTKFLIATPTFLVQATNQVVLSPPGPATSLGNIISMTRKGGSFRESYAQ
ncbi:hypothetical protein TNCV_747971 [Trichonephila clavipes]|nr:hypothetical protein TNCV_747971 [Trichonephila clavipes]